MCNRLLAVLAVFATLGLLSCGAPSPEEFGKKAAVIALYEVEAGKLAGEKGQSDAVKEFGRQMVEAYTKTGDELKSVIEAEKIKLDLPSRLDKKRQHLIDALNQAEPGDFDKLFAEQQVASQKVAAKLFDAYAERGGNAALKQFAANVLPTIKQHLAEAEKLPQ
jgi:putative membrane protein